MSSDARSSFPVYQGSIYSLLQRSSRNGPAASYVLAISSAHSGSGVTYLTRLLVDALNRDVPGSAVGVDCGNFDEPTTLVDQRSKVASRSAQIELNPQDHGAWRSSPEFRAQYIQGLRDRFAYVVLDCRPISESSEVLGLSGLVDGIVSVVEANRTTKAQISYVERTVAQAGGKMLGHVLNKRTYLLPQWLHERLEQMGI